MLWDYGAILDSPGPYGEGVVFSEGWCKTRRDARPEDCCSSNRLQDYNMDDRMNRERVYIIRHGLRFFTFSAWRSLSPPARAGSPFSLFLGRGMNVCWACVSKGVSKGARDHLTPSVLNFDPRVVSWLASFLQFNGKLIFVFLRSNTPSLSCPSFSLSFL